MKQPVPLPPKYRLKHLFFDLDDTLWATALNHKVALKQLYALKGWDRLLPPFEEFMQEYQPVNNRLWDAYRDGTVSKQELILSRLRIPLEPYLHRSDEAFYLRLNEEFFTLIRRQKEVEPFALEVLQKLGRYYKIHIISNGFVQVQGDKLSGSGLAPLINGQVILSEVAQANKPSPKIFSYACSAANARRSESVMIGDNWGSDMVGAAGFGMAAIWYNPAQVPFPADAAPLAPEHIPVITSLKELLPLLL